MRNFLSMAVNLQLFKQFIDGRLAKLNAGRGFSDIFEEEITDGGFCGSNSKSYQQWMHTVKRGGALINTAVTKAKGKAKRGIRDFKGRLKARDEEDEGMTFRSGSPTSTNSLSPRRLQKMRRQHNFNKSPMGLGLGLDDDDLDTASKISSEDSGEVASYAEDSDDSYSMDLDTDSSRAGQMNLLEEILDSLSTTAVEQGKLSGAKSLDFFRSMDELDYTGPNKASSECPPADGSGGEQGGWNMGQDDSAIHGRHLPPSPRRLANNPCRKVSHNRTASTPPTASSTQNAVVSRPPSGRWCRPTVQPPPPPVSPAASQQGDCFSYSPSLSRRPGAGGPPPSPTLSTVSSPVQLSCTSAYSPPPAGRCRTLSEPAEPPQPPQPPNLTASTSILRRKVLSKETVRQYQEKVHMGHGGRGRMSHAVPIPWEREAASEEAAPPGGGPGPGQARGPVAADDVQEKGLLEEIESMCHLSTAFNSRLDLSQGQCYSNKSHSPQSQAQGKATDKSEDTHL